MVCVYVYCMCPLSTASQCTQRGMAVQAAVCFRGHGGVTAWVRGFCGHGRDVIGRRRGGCGLRGAVDHCCTCAAKNTRQRIGFIEIYRIIQDAHVNSASNFKFPVSIDVVICMSKDG